MSSTTLVQFLEGLYPNLNDRLLIEVKGIAPSWVKVECGIRRRFAKSISEAADMIQNFNAMQSYGTYIGVLPRTGRGSTKSYVDGGWTCWVDIDDKQFNSAMDAEKALLRGIRELGEEPFCIVHSGHGFHAYWRLTRYHMAHEIEGSNMALAQIFKSDSVSDCTRVLRAPFTRNNKEPQHPEICSILNYTHGLHALSTDRFLTALTRKPGQIESGGPEMTSCSFSLSRLTPMWVKYIEQGLAADTLGYYRGDRSSLDMAVANELVINGFTDDEVYSIFTNPNLAISDKALEKGSQGRAYIKYTLNKAKQYVERLDRSVRF